jgi:hypothetical protein
MCRGARLLYVLLVAVSHVQVSHIVLIPGKGMVGVYGHPGFFPFRDFSAISI